MYRVLKLLKKIVLCGSIFVMSIVFSLHFEMSVHAEEESPRYEIRVNRAANCVTVYEKDENGAYTVPVKAMPCSCGIQLDYTPLGIFSTSDYYEWRLMVDNTYGQYAVRFVNRILFHSVPYLSDAPDTLVAEEYNKLGEPASHGCVRLTANDSKWIYDNCEKGTTVIVYDDKENPGPLGKPSAMKISSDHPYKNWDPTDITKEENPWKNDLPRLYLTRDMGDGVIYVPVGATQEELKAAIGLRNAQGLPYGGEAYQIYVNGTYDLNTFGAYKVRVTGIDAIGRMIEQEMMLAVVYM
ncbi:MAG: L,D-transpeptidase [Lachnospiraceae bacterium]|nr:L,D-transpeptidase [Lachnospiraceae bacterium]